MSKWRKYLYLLVDRFDQGNYPLRRIDASTLFFSTTNHKKITAATATAGIDEDARLPQPFITFNASPSADSGSRVLDFFTLFGRGKNKSLIAGADENGFTFIYDLSQHTVYHQRRLNQPKQTEAVSLAIGKALYVMDRSPLPRSRCGFEALVYDRVRASQNLENIEDWRWRCLKPPPYVLETGYKPTRIAAYTVVGDSHIWISTPDIGTYSLDTLARTWSKVGKWVLPFRDRAHYIPECDSWLGFSSKTGLLCSSDLKTASAQTRPVVSTVLEEEMPECDGYDLSESYLVHLGSGQFCVAKFFQREYSQVSKEEGSVCSQFDKFVILTGLVMDLDGPGGVLRMRKHKSRRYMLTTMGMGWLF